jgi:hypothetical protein
MLDLLEQLVDKSLITVELDDSGNPRYTMIETVWHYSREKLEASGEAPAVRDRHLEYFLTFAEEAAPNLEGPEQRSWLDRRNRALQFSFRRGMDRQITEGRGRAALDLGVVSHLELRGNLAEAWDIATRLLALPDGDVSPRYKAASRIAVGRIAWAAGRYDDARNCYAEAADIRRHWRRSHSAWRTCSWDFWIVATASWTSGAPLSPRTGHRAQVRGTYLEAGGLSGLGSIAMDRGNLPQARAQGAEPGALRASRRSMGHRSHPLGPHRGRHRSRLPARPHRAGRVDANNARTRIAGFFPTFEQPCRTPRHNQAKRAATLFGATEACVKILARSCFTRTGATRNLPDNLKQLLPEQNCRRPGFWARRVAVGSYRKFPGDHRVPLAAAGQPVQRSLQSRQPCVSHHPSSIQELNFFGWREALILARAKIS